MHLFEYKSCRTFADAPSRAQLWGHSTRWQFVLHSKISHELGVHNAPLTPHKHHPPPTIADTDIETSITVNWTGMRTHKERGLS